MRKTKMQTGITLVALIITIIILLILAVVTIGSINNGNIITYALNASTGYSTKKDEEETLIDDYESIIKGNLPGGDKVTYTDENVPIPAGFYYVTGEKDTGLVISDDKSDENNANGKEGNQFVWVPVDNINDMVMCQICGGKGILDKKTLQCSEHGTSTKLAGKLYAEVMGDYFNTSLTEQYYNNLSLKEPDVVNEYDSVKANLEKAGLIDLTAESFKNLLQKEFDEMAESVAKYGGFYVGRYETSKNGVNPESKYGATSATAATESANTWYGLYALNKKYTTSSVKSSMIWGSQYDAMMIWMGEKATSTIGDKKNQTRECGKAPEDVIKNVYDIYGNSLEWTLEANNNSNRVWRGYIWMSEEKSPTYRTANLVNSTDNQLSSRLTLYIL